MPVHTFSFMLPFCILIVASSNVLRGFNDDICDPHIVTSEHYPSLLVGLSIQQTSPIKLKATYRLPNSTKQFSFEGMVYTGGFEKTAETAACRSLGCSKSAGATKMTWYAESNCEFTCPDGSSAMQKCRYMIKEFACASDAMNLLECLTSEQFWYYASYTPGSMYQGVSLKCIECGD